MFRVRHTSCASKFVWVGSIFGFLAVSGVTVAANDKDNDIHIKKAALPFSEYSCKDCIVLRSSLNSAGQAHFDMLTNMSPNKVRCESMAYGVMLNILTDNVVGIKHQLDTLGSCDDCVLNYKLIKIIQKMEAIGEQEGLNYYRTWIEEDIWGLLPIGKRLKLYHEVNKQWIWPTMAALTTVSPLVFKALPKGPFAIWGKNQTSADVTNKK